MLVMLWRGAAPAAGPHAHKMVKHSKFDTSNFPSSDDESPSFAGPTPDACFLNVGHAACESALMLTLARRRERERSDSASAALTKAELRLQVRDENAHLFRMLECSSSIGNC